VAADVTVEEQVVAAVAKTTGLLGRIDVLVNAAGRLTQAPLVEMPLAQWHETFGR
jgi:3-oxoacyl-[acyl-carrier protein] reductase